MYLVVLLIILPRYAAKGNCDNQYPETSNYYKTCIEESAIDIAQLCEKKGKGSLLRMETKDEFDFIMNQMNDGEFWVGAKSYTDDDSAVRWRWDNTDIEPLSIMWKDNNVPTDADKCATLKTDGMRLKKCGDRRPGICEKASTIETSTMITTTHTPTTQDTNPTNTSLAITSLETSSKRETTATFKGAKSDGNTLSTSAVITPTDTSTMITSIHTPTAQATASTSSLSATTSIDATTTTLTNKKSGDNALSTLDTITPAAAITETPTLFYASTIRTTATRASTTTLKNGKSGDITLSISNITITNPTKTEFTADISSNHMTTQQAISSTSISAATTVPHFTTVSASTTPVINEISEFERIGIVGSVERRIRNQTQDDPFRQLTEEYQKFV
uniref:Cell wall protein DAN4-like n=1 Tax=Saccoglossus kowalevskii TaxID=10224 RepID=A0ABM0M8R9_SACKO|nr:PREDICTED: cell wall protein DAN4-like [Saccoglossus kowalevskii]